MASLAFPTARHQFIADLAASFFKGQAEVDTVLVVNSCARGQAAPESDLDLAVLVTPAVAAERCRQLEMAWLSFCEANTEVVEFRRASPFAQVHLDVIDGQFVTTSWDDGGGPDSFEVEIGNRVAFAVPFGEPGFFFENSRRDGSHTMTRVCVVNGWRWCETPVRTTWSAFHCL